MEAGTKKKLIIGVSIAAVIGLAYFAWRQWGGGTPIFGPGRVDRESKQKRTFIKR